MNDDIRCARYVISTPNCEELTRSGQYAYEFMRTVFIAEGMWFDEAIEEAASVLRAAWQGEVQHFGTNLGTELDFTVRIAGEETAEKKEQR